jgi:predicted amidophosphoribosyltransferase
MNVCSHCKMEVENNALRCPYCLENPYDNFMFETGGIFSTIMEYIIAAAVIGVILMWIF